MSSEAGTVFGNANSIFNNIMSATQGIVAGGPSQQGITGEALTALNTTAEQGGAAMTRNLKGAAIAGGGNVATPAGGNLATDFNAEQTGAAQTAQQKNAIQTASGEIGRQNFWNAEQTEQQAPSVFNEANNFNASTGNQLSAAQKSQQNMDTQTNWWKDPVMKVGAYVSQFIPVVGPAISMAISDVKQNYDSEQAQVSGNNPQPISQPSSQPSSGNIGTGQDVDTQGGW